MIAQALDIIGSKATAATLLNGDDLSSGLMQLDPGMSLLQELAKRVMSDETVTTRESIAARLAAAGATLKRAMETGARDLVGVSVEQIAQPDPNRRQAMPVSLPGALPIPPVLSPTTITAAALELPLLPSLGNGHGAAQPTTTSGDDLTWSEVVVRQCRKGRGPAPAGDSLRAIQYSFFAE